MLETLKGIVIAVRNFKENDRIISVVTTSLGIIDIIVKGGQKINGKNNSSTQQFAYSKFCVQKRNEYYYLNSSEPINIFYGIRNDLKKVALASYIGEVLRFAITTGQPDRETIRLVLNLFYLLSETDTDCNQLKCIFEFRLSTYLGYMPQLIGCSECFEVYPDETVMYYEDGRLVCKKHIEKINKEKMVVLDSLKLHIIRLICLTDLKKCLSFKLKGQLAKEMTSISEKYFLDKMERGFKTLDFYKEIL